MHPYVSFYNEIPSPGGSGGDLAKGDLDLPGTLLDQAPRISTDGDHVEPLIQALFSDLSG